MKSTSLTTHLLSSSLCSVLLPQLHHRNPQHHPSVTHPRSSYAPTPRTQRLDSTCSICYAESEAGFTDLPGAAAAPGNPDLLGTSDCRVPSTTSLRRLTQKHHWLPLALHSCSPSLQHTLPFTYPQPKDKVRESLLSPYPDWPQSTADGMLPPDTSGPLRTRAGTAQGVPLLDPQG